ncbi:MAG TPA: D-2-hydroxyacid dehydrogenase [Methylomirabilota bacterium]|jgi:phosphoglycerate dehydrogenase-like enzyme|nr:D-2-hydroxyacid dehydrogenase [Methylomirabilota bacterium]
MTTPPVTVLIASALESPLIDRIRAVDRRLDVAYRADLVGHPRYAGDHTGPVMRTAAQAAEWAALVAEAEVMFDVDRASDIDLVRQAPRLRWVQLSSSGVGHVVGQMGLGDCPIVVTNAAGVHATPLAEFVLFAMLYFAKRMPRVLADQRRHHWERFALDTLPGKTLGIVGFGHVGRAIARLARSAGLRILAVRRTSSDPSGSPDVDAVYPRAGLGTLLGESDYVALIVPLTSETTGLLGKAEISAMKPGAVLINIGRGQLVDEAALIEALRSGHLGGAALDVFASEPLAAASPLWDLPNVLVTPHSMSTAFGENELLVDLFCDNLRRYLAGDALRNVFDRKRGY